MKTFSLAIFFDICNVKFLVQFNIHVYNIQYNIQYINCDRILANCQETGKVFDDELQFLMMLIERSGALPHSFTNLG